MKILKKLTRVSLALLMVFSGYAIAAQPTGWKIRVSVERQRVTAIHGGKIAREMICSTGIPGTDDETPAGDFILNESGAKRGKWFYSDRYKEGAKYWVGFIGGTYLFHSVPMDRNGNVIAAEAEKLGKPASHGCVRLSVEDARWFYETVPDGSAVHIEVPKIRQEQENEPREINDHDMKGSVSAWLDTTMLEYKQKHLLSCEIALVRVSLAIAGIRDVSEEEILDAIPKGTDPEIAFVCDDINAGRRNKDGSIHWNNYGTHAPVVAKSINSFFEKRGKADAWEAKELVADDRQLRKIITDDPDFRGAVVWLVGHPARWGAHPPVNERGMVLGEHVRFVAPKLSPNGYFRIHDPENGRLIETPSAGASRDLFSYRIVGLFERNKRTGSIEHPADKQSTVDSRGTEKIARGVPASQSRSGAMISLANAVKSSIAHGNDGKTLVLLALIALFYGVLHALGPGHQKTLVSGYLLSEGGGPGTAIAAAGIASISHALSVIGLFSALLILGSGFGLMDVARAGKIVTLASGFLLVALATLMSWKKTALLIETIRGKDTKGEGCGCGKRHPGGQGCPHGGETHAAKRGTIPLLISGSLAPCPGAAIFLLYGFHEGNVLAGVIAVAALSLGMWITLIAVGLASVAVRTAGITEACRQISSVAKILPHVFGVCGSLAILAFAVLTLFSA